MKRLTNFPRSCCFIVTYFSSFQHQVSMVILFLHRALGWLWLYLVKEEVPRINYWGVWWQRKFSLQQEYLLFAEVDGHHHHWQWWNPWYHGWSESWAPPHGRKGVGCAPTYLVVGYVGFAVIKSRRWINWRNIVWCTFATSTARWCIDVWLMENRAQEFGGHRRTGTFCHNHLMVE